MISLSSNGDFGCWECTQNVSKSFQPCGACASFAETNINMIIHDLILSLFVAGAVLCAGIEVWKCSFHGRRRES